MPYPIGTLASPVEETVETNVYSLSLEDSEEIPIENSDTEELAVQLRAIQPGPIVGPSVVFTSGSNEGNGQNSDL